MGNSNPDPPNTTSHCHRCPSSFTMEIKWSNGGPYRPVMALITCPARIVTSNPISDKSQENSPLFSKQNPPRRWLTIFIIEVREFKSHAPAAVDGKVLEPDRDQVTAVCTLERVQVRRWNCRARVPNM
ncbi:unnamed protein product [Coregonus sp. 'balchen']|nr:unnamed protein product [Coregonus sp. 'balchen']